MLELADEPILAEETYVDFCGVRGQSETLKNVGSAEKSVVCFRSGDSYNLSMRISSKFILYLQ